MTTQLLSPRQTLCGMILSVIRIKCYPEVYRQKRLNITHHDWEAHAAGVDEHVVEHHLCTGAKFRG